MKNLLLIVALISATVVPNLGFILHANQFALKFIDIGQGDSILVRTPTNCTMLIDGGPLNNLTDQLEKHLPANEHKIDLLVLSHPHLDHMGGLIQVLNRYEVSNIFTTGVSYKSSFYREFNSLTEDLNVIYPRTGKVYDLCGVTINIIYPDRSLIGKEIDNVNDASIVLQLEIRGQKIYLSGDAEIEAEHEILKLNLDLRSDIMKAGHHGSSTSNSFELLQKVSPKTFVIQSGEGNQYKHPRIEAINNARSVGAEIRRNDIEGTITFFF